MYLCSRYDKMQNARQEIKWNKCFYMYEQTIVLLLIEESIGRLPRNDTSVKG